MPGGMNFGVGNFGGGNIGGGDVTPPVAEE